MKKLMYLLPALAFVFAIGCTPKEEPDSVPPAPEAPHSQSETSSPEASDMQEAAPRPEAHRETAGEIVEQYATGLTTAPGKARAANAKVEMAAVQTAVTSYKAMNGDYPASLAEVQSDMQAGFDMSRFAYDPATGKVSLK